MAMINILIHAQKNELRIQNQRLRDCMDPFLIPTERFMERYRMPPHLAQKLISEISPFVDDHDELIPLHLRVLSTLNFYASGSYQRIVGMDAFGMMSQTMISKSISEISKVITNNLGHVYVRFPTTQQEVDMIKQRFVEDHDLSGVMALVDGTHIRIAAVPLNKKIAYMNRRRFPSINTQVIIDSDMRILDVNARYPGSTHDTLIWGSSEIFALLETKFNLDDQNDNIYRNSFLLGDLGYPLQPWLMIPVKDVADDQVHEKRYNKKHRKTRNKIERFNACWKNRFRCILGERAFRYSHEKAGYIIYACATLHNFLIENSFDIEYGIPPYVERDCQENEDDDDVDIDLAESNMYLSRGRAVREQLIADFF